MRLKRGQPRPAALAGLFYPESARALRAAVDGYVSAGRDRAVASAATRALLAPHAGYVYSGPTAGVAFARLQRPPERVVMVGPSHRVAIPGISAGDFDAYECPLGRMPVDRAAIAALEAADRVTVLPEAHAEEHCLEVMLPFLLEVVGAVPIVPLLVGAASPAQVDAALEAVLRDDDLLLISSDLSHFQPYDAARSRDLATLRAVTEGRSNALGPYDACGYKGLGGAIRLATRQGWSTTLLDYRNSGDTAGDRDRVVGYGATSFDDDRDGPRQEQPLTRPRGS